MAAPRLILLNGGSSSGKTSVARELQSLLADPWLRFGVDTLLDAAPPALLAGDGVTFGSGGDVGVGPSFREVESAWMAGLASMARYGAHLLVEDNLLGGRDGQLRWTAALADVPVGWVGVRCDAAVAERREGSRSDRIAGMAVKQAELVHRGVRYDLEVDTTEQPPDVVATAIKRHFGLRGRSS